ncbi:MAG: rod shape-determining protein RodA [Candidatus Omnitrophica bacterium]|nr:rod shape-determining protein RodA [Candidatus Omnitrophota bacterium]
MYRSEYRRSFDVYLFVLPIIIFCIGLFFLYSASRGMQEIKGINFTARQVTWFFLSVAIAFVVANIDFRRFLDWSYLYYFLIVALLITILFIGGARMGAKRWLSIGGFTLQPSEFAKLALIMTIAHYLGNNRYSSRSIKIFFSALIMTAFVFILIFKEPDLGGALALLPILFAILIASDIPLGYILGSLILGVLSSPLLWYVMKDYQKRRLLVFLNPNMDPLGAGYTIIQSKIAIGSGGIFGKGWMSGTQNQLNFLPERHTDFIFSVVGEEWGFVGCLLVILLFSLLIFRVLQVAGRTNDYKGKLVVVGIAAMLSFQMIVNIAMTAGFMPVVGLPLPLISYGGSSLITTWIAIALVINVDMRRTIF